MDDEVLVEVESEVEETQAPEAEAQPNTEVEDKARRMGWKPQEEYKGDPNRWTDAESFVKVGEERIPVMKENYRKLEDKYTNLEQQVKQQREYQEHMGKVQYERAMKELKAEQKEAVEDADTEKFEQLEQRKEQIKVDYSPKQSTQKPNEVAAWETRNTWYQNPILADKAVKLEKRILEEEAFKQSQDYQYRPMNLSDRLEEVSRRFNADFTPQKEVARKLPAVEGARQSGSGKTAAKTWGDIDPNHMEAANAQVKCGLLTKAEYLKDYFGE